MTFPVPPAGLTYDEEADVHNLLAVARKACDEIGQLADRLGYEICITIQKYED